MATTALDIVADALRELGVLASGEVASAGEALSGLAALNRMVDGWAAERLTMYTVSRTTYALVSGTQVYTVGTGGNFNVARPVFVDHFSVYDSAVTPNAEVQLEAFTDDSWAVLPEKSTPGTPSAYYYNGTFATGSLSLWPKPNVSGLVGVLYAPLQVSEFALLSTAVSLPPGYRRMLVKGLAVEMGPSYDKPLSQELYTQAREAKMVVKNANVRMRDMSIDSSMLFGRR
jgi:hypothetical protein